MNKAFSILIPAICFIIVYLAFQYVFIIGHVPTSSMEPVIKEESYILGCRIHEEPVRGDIIIFERNDKLHVKRVMAIEGEQVCQNGTMIKVPNGCFYVIGDNRGESIDSRDWEEPFIEEAQIVGILIYPKNDF